MRFTSFLIFLLFLKKDSLDGLLSTWTQTRVPGQEISIKGNFSSSRISLAMRNFPRDLLADRAKRISSSSFLETARIKALEAATP